MPDIKTRVVAEKSIKTLDKSAIAAQRMKNAYVYAKEKAERSAPVDQESPESYAADWISDKASTAAFEGVYQLDRQGRRGLDATKANIAKARARFQRKRLTDPLKKKVQRGATESASSPVEGNIRRNPGPQRAANPVRRPAGRSAGAGRAAHGGQAPIKTVERAGKTVKQSARSTTEACNPLQLHRCPGYAGGRGIPGQCSVGQPPGSGGRVSGRQGRIKEMEQPKPLHRGRPPHKIAKEQPFDCSFT